MDWNTPIQYECVDWESLIDRVLQNEPDVLGAIAGITITEERLSQGYKFSQPYIDTGVSLIVEGNQILSIMIDIQIGKRETWQFLKFFSFDILLVWIIFNITFLSFLIRWLEGSYLHILEYMWHSTAHLFINGAISQRSYIGKMIDFCQLLMNIILTSLFCALIVQNYAFRYSISN